jgi:leucyl-tRNA synthetase
LASLSNLALSMVETAKRDEMTHLERWLLSRLQQRIAEVTGNLEELKTRTALEIALFETWNDFRWYIRRKGGTEAKAVQEALEVWLRLLAPFAPFVCEELWSAAGKKSFISLAEWPRVNEDKVDVLAEERENLVTDLIEDTLNVLKATKISPTRICYYTATGWKWRVYRNLVARAVEGEVKVNDVMRELAKDSSLRENMKDVASFVPKVLKALSKLPSERKARLAKVEMANEKEIIEDALGFLKERFNAEVTVYGEEDKARYDPKQRATLATPGQPAIYIE